MPTITKLYSMQEATQHNTREDCWVIIDGKVYDVTAYLDDHPGGDDVLLSAAGRDSTEDFEDAGHSSDARKLMEDYFVGEIDTSCNTIPDTSCNTIPELTIVAEDQPSGFTRQFLKTAAEYWALPAAAISISVAVAAVFYSHKR